MEDLPLLENFKQLFFKDINKIKYLNAVYQATKNSEKNEEQFKDFSLTLFIKILYHLAKINDAYIKLRNKYIKIYKINNELLANIEKKFIIFMLDFPQDKIIDVLNKFKDSNKKKYKFKLLIINRLIDIFEQKKYISVDETLSLNYGKFFINIFNLNFIPIQIIDEKELSELDVEYFIIINQFSGQENILLTPLDKYIGIKMANDNTVLTNSMFEYFTEFKEFKRKQLIDENIITIFKPNPNLDISFDQSNKISLVIKLDSNLYQLTEYLYDFNHKPSWLFNREPTQGLLRHEPAQGLLRHEPAQGLFKITDISSEKFLIFHPYTKQFYKKKIIEKSLEQLKILNYPEIIYIKEEQNYAKDLSFDEIIKNYFTEKNMLKLDSKTINNLFLEIKLFYELNIDKEKIANYILSYI